MRPRGIRQKKGLQLVEQTAQQVAQGTTALKAQASGLQRDLQKLMRRFGRQCRGQGKVFVTLVRQTEKHLLEVGEEVGPLARAAQQCVHEAPSLAEEVRTRLDTKLTAAIEAHQGIEKPSRRLTQGKKLSHYKIVKAYDGTIAPICKGRSNCPAQFGKKPGLMAEMASGFTFALHLPVGNPGDASYVVPLIDQVQQASAQVTGPRKPVIHSLAGNLALHDTSWRETWHTRGILMVGIPRTIEPITPSPTQEEVRQILTPAGLPRQRTPYQVHIACAQGDISPLPLGSFWSKHSLAQRVLALLSIRAEEESARHSEDGGVARSKSDRPWGASVG